MSNRFALAFEMVGKVFTAFLIGRLWSAAPATPHDHDAIGSSFYREIDKNNHGWEMRCHCGVLSFLCLSRTISEDQ